MLFKDKLKEPVIYKGSNKAINELNQIQEYLKTHTSKELEKKARLIQYGIEGEENILFELTFSCFFLVCFVKNYGIKKCNVK